MSKSQRLKEGEGTNNLKGYKGRKEDSDSDSGACDVESDRP